MSLPERTAIAILAGGYGTRLWPLSRRDFPKQFVPIINGVSMLRATFERAASVVGNDAVLVVGDMGHAALYREQLPEIPPQNLILEPVGRGTATCIALTAAVELKRDRFDTVVTIPVDHIILDLQPWIEATRAAVQRASDSDELVVVGANPVPGESKFGYIVAGDVVSPSATAPVRSVLRFVEKPHPAELEALLVSNLCFRNMGMLAFKPDVLLSQISKHLPAMNKAIEMAASRMWAPEALRLAYESIQSASIDNSVLALSDKVSVAIGPIASIDAGDFASIGMVLDHDESHNAASGDTIVVDSTGNTIFTEDATVAVVGVKDLVIIVREDVIMICPKDQTQRINEIAE